MFKAPGPDGLPDWVLKEYAVLLAQPVSDILNAPHKEQKLPSVWKLADITPFPKIADDFIVSDYIKPALEEKVAPNQFGTIAGSSTVMALIRVAHKWLEATDGNGAAVPVFLFDYRKAFDLVDHHILANKLQQLNIPHSVINWVIDFLCNRFQRVKLSKDCLSEWGKVPSGVPQGTKPSPWLFLPMIHDH
ncbi:uncharacterized protein [Acropora muricata]|uniref:uncharacterized protein n=1 Tax=Acropora muricata TaxID=159855 RepID=UPI0034E59132